MAKEWINRRWRWARPGSEVRYEMDYTGTGKRRPGRLPLVD